MSRILEVEKITKKYPAFLLDNASFSLESGSIMGFIGRNGAGKTTIIKSILNLIHTDSGTIRIFGKSYTGRENDIKERIGYATSSNIFYPRKTLKEITEMTRIFYRNWDQESYEKYIALFNLDESKKMKDLSEGMKVKYSIALALSHRAELLILDEPTSGLDPVSRDEILTIFRNLKENGTSILFSTHITSDLEKCADWITYIKSGVIIKSEELSAFLSSYPECRTLDDIIVSIEKNA